MTFKLCPKCLTRKDASKQKKNRSKSYGRTKGLSFERWVANRLKKIFPDAKRHLEFQVDEARHGVDLMHTGRYLVQCKAFNKYPPITCIEEVKVCPIEGGVPVLIAKGDRQRPITVLYLDHFLELVRKAELYERR